MANPPILRIWRYLAGRPTIEKDPDDELDYLVAYHGRLPEQDRISTVAAIATGVDLVRTEISGDGKYVTVWVKGGRTGQPAFLEIRAVTFGTGSFPRTVDVTLYFNIRPS